MKILQFSKDKIITRQKFVAYTLMVIYMDKLSEFKAFVKDKPFLQEKVNKKETTWQNLYETYDLFGENADIFKQNSGETRNLTSGGNTTNLLKMLEGVNLDKISENLEGVKKILGVLGEFTKKEEPKASRRNFYKSPRSYDD